MEIAEVAGLESAIAIPPPPHHLHVFTFAYLTGKVQSVLVRAMSPGGQA
jgi:hypothetical protein